MSDIVFGVRIKSDSRELAGDMANAAKSIERVGQAADRSFQQGAISAKQMQAAMRGVPAQFTDIFTSIAAGQNPMQVLLQQGGQLKDMFGGIGPAARALGGYVVGLINPLTLTAAAAAAVVTAWAQGDAESARFRKALAVTGNAAGVTADELRRMARAAAEVSGSGQGAAADVVTRLATSAKVSAEVMPQVTTAIVNMSAVGGAAAEDLVKQFAEIGKDPVKGVQKLNDAYNLLEPAIYAQVASLQAQGREEEAIRLAQVEAAKAVDERAKEVKASLSSLERAWDEIGSAAARAWNRMVNAVSEEDLQKQIAAAVKELARLRTLPDDGTGFNDWEIAQLEERLRTLLSNTAQAQRDRAAADRERKAANDALSGALGRIEEIETRASAKTRGLNEALAEYRKTLDVIRQHDPNSAMLDPEHVAQIEAGIRKQYETLKRTKPAIDENAKALDNWYESRKKGLATIDDEIEAERAAREAMGLTRAEIKEQEAAKLELAAGAKEVEAANLSEAASFAGPLAGAYREAATDAERAAAKLRELAAAKRDTAGTIRAEEREEEEEKLADKAIAEQRRAAEASGAFWNDAYQDVGREITDAIFEGGRDGWDLLKKSIEATFIRAYVQPVLTQGVAAIGGALGLGPGAGVSGGPGLLSNAGSLATNGSLLYQYGAGTMSGANAAGTFFANSTGSGLDGLIAATDGWGTAPGASGVSGLGVLGGAGAGALLGYQLGGGNPAGTFAGGAAGIAGYGAIAGAAAGSGAAAGAAAALAAVPVWGWVALAALALAGGMATGGTPHVGGAAFSTLGGDSGLATDANTPGFGLSWGAYRSTRGGDRSAAVDRSVAQVIGAVAGDTLGRAVRYGGDASGLTLTGKFAADGEDKSRGGYLVTGADGQQIFRLDKSSYSKDPKKGFEQFGGDSVRAEIAALQATDLDDWFDQILGAVDPLTDSLDVLTQALQLADEVAQQVALADQIKAIGEQDAMEAVRQANLSATSAWFESSERIRQAAADGSLSVAQMAELAAQHYRNEVQLLQRISQASANIAAGYDDSRRNVELAGLTNGQQYDYVNAEVTRYMDVLKGLTDADEIERYGQLIRRDLDQAFGLLSPEQQLKYKDQFLKRYDDAEQLTQDRLDVVEKKVLDEGETLFADLTDAADREITRITDAAVKVLEAARDAVPSTITVRTVIESPTPAYTSVEFGDGP